jgi:glutaredoxin
MWQVATFIVMEKPIIVAYLKPSCGWSRGVRAVFHKYKLPYDERDIKNVPANRAEMVEKSGQEFSPCVVINGQMLADISGEELEQYLLTNHLVAPTDREADAPLNRCGCH